MIDKIYLRNFSPCSKTSKEFSKMFLQFDTLFPVKILYIFAMEFLSIFSMVRNSSSCCFSHFFSSIHISKRIVHNLRKSIFSNYYIYITNEDILFKNISRSRCSRGLNMHLYDDIGDASSALRGSKSSFMITIL